MKLKVATCQFPVSADPDRNARFILRQLTSAAKRGAHVAHFGEGALSGYAPVTPRSFEDYDWVGVRRGAQKVMEAARELRLWVVLGSAHPLSGRRKPHNSVYVIDREGKLADRYDKQFCAGRADDPAGELAHYTPGSHFCVFDVRGVRCGVLICHEYRYPELYREYKRRGVHLILHSFHAGRLRPPELRRMEAQVGRRFHRLNRGKTLPEITMPASAQAASASSHLWISAANTSAPESCWGSLFVRPDGVIVGRLRRNRPGVLITEVDTGAKLYDSTRPWRERAMSGTLHSGRLVRDARSSDRKSL